MSSAPSTVITTSPESITLPVVELLNTYAPVFVTAFAVTLFFTPVARRIALRAGVVDLPDVRRKMHRAPVPYLGGIAVFMGLMAAILISYMPQQDSGSGYLPVPFAVVLGMAAITFTGLADDVWGWDPRLKFAGQLVAAAGLAISEIGSEVAVGFLAPVFGGPAEPIFEIGGRMIINDDLYYWVGTAIIAMFVLGGCNAANFIDGLDGLLSGVVAIVAVGLLAISVLMAAPEVLAPSADDEGSLAGARIVLCLAILGAVLGFLPHNFNPASIFLGDSGSLLLGYMCVVVILMFGENGRSHVVLAGLIVFALPIMDTTLAIIRRRLAGVPMSAADSQHIHHQVRRALGGVRRAVLALYLISASFAVLGVTLAALVVLTELRVGFVYAIAFVLFASIGVVAVKAARQGRLEAAVREATEKLPRVSPTKRPLEEKEAVTSDVRRSDDA